MPIEIVLTPGKPKKGPAGKTTPEKFKKKKKGVAELLKKYKPKSLRAGAGKDKKPTGTKKPGKPARTEKPGVPHGVDKKTQEGEQILNVAKGGSVSKFGMLSVKAGVDNNPNPTQADRIVGATKKMKRGGKVTGRSIGPAGASIVSKDGKRIKQLKTIAKSVGIPGAAAGLASGIQKTVKQLAGRLAKRGYGKARK